MLLTKYSATRALPTRGAGASGHLTALCRYASHNDGELLKKYHLGEDEEMVLKYLSATQGRAIDRQNRLAEKKIVDSYVHEIKVFFR